MTAFRFDAEAALKRAREGRPLPNLPNRPNRDGADGAGLGGLGGLGPERDLPPASAPDLRACLAAARARVARLSDADGIARSEEAIEAVWDEAEALAAVRQAEGIGAPSIFSTPKAVTRRPPNFLRGQNETKKWGPADRKPAAQPTSHRAKLSKK